MDTNQDQGRELHSSNALRRVFDDYSSGVAYIAVIDKNGDEHIGSCFHIGDGVFITAKHVVDGVTIKEIGTTVSQRKYFQIESERPGVARVEIPFSPKTTVNYKGPYFHPNKDSDVAAIIVSEIDAPVLMLGDHLDDWLGNELILSEAVVMGYPPIPFSGEPVLLSTKCEINAIVDKYTGGHPHFILSTMARGGFSGAPAITPDGIVLGVVTESLVADNKPIELGYLSVMSVEGIYMCLSHNRIVPKHVDKQWDGFWNEESVMFTEDFENIHITLYRGEGEYYLKIYSDKPEIFENAILLIKNGSSSYSLDWTHDKLVKVEFKEKQLSLEEADVLFKNIIMMVEELGAKRS